MRQKIVLLQRKEKYYARRLFSSYSIITISGNSMYPTLHDKDQVVFSSVQPKKLLIGDIVVFKREDGAFVCHRVVDINCINNQLLFYLQGDRSDKIDVVLSDNIIGRVRAVMREGKIRDVGILGSRVFYYLCLTKQMRTMRIILEKVVAYIFCFKLARWTAKHVFMLKKVNYRLIKDVENNANFKYFASFCNKLYFLSKPLGYLAIRKKKIVGKLLISRDKDKVVLVGPYVRVFYRGRKIATYLVENALREMRSHSHLCIYTFVPYSKRVDIRSLKFFYKKLGFGTEKVTAEGVYLKIV